MRAALALTRPAGRQCAAAAGAGQRCALERKVRDTGSTWLEAAEREAMVRMPTLVAEHGRIDEQRRPRHAPVAQALAGVGAAQPWLQQAPLMERSLRGRWKPPQALRGRCAGVRDAGHCGILDELARASSPTAASSAGAQVQGSHFNRGGDLGEPPGHARSPLPPAAPPSSAAAASNLEPMRALVLRRHGAGIDPNLNMMFVISCWHA